jgi:hypothetical protein
MSCGISLRKCWSQYCCGLKSAQNAVMSPLNLTVMTAVFAALVLACASGCGRTVLVNSGNPMRVGPQTKGQMYTQIRGEWVLSPDVVEVPEGWYVVPPEYAE